MAIDTEAKRKSILGFGSGDLLPNPDGTIAAADRLTLLWLYGGIAASAPPDVRVIYRPRTTVNPDAYRPGSVGGPSAYRPLSAVLPGAYRPTNPSLPSG